MIHMVCHHIIMEDIMVMVDEDIVDVVSWIFGNFDLKEKEFF
jgi:hypothetical protein